LRAQLPKSEKAQLEWFILESIPRIQKYFEVEQRTDGHLESFTNDFILLKGRATALREQKTLLSLLFQCFWPFHFPYPAYRWELFPANKVFYPLASLLDYSDVEMQHTIIGIFAELPRLDDAEILEFLLPLALQWSKHTDPEHRRLAPNILARVNQENALQALDHLLADADPQVKESAKSAVGYTRRARA
jgi:hypothetical protein